MGLTQRCITGCTLFNIYNNHLIHPLQSIHIIHCLIDVELSGRRRQKLHTKINVESTLNSSLEFFNIWCRNKNMFVNLSKWATIFL